MLLANYFLPRSVTPAPLSSFITLGALLTIGPFQGGGAVRGGLSARVQQRHQAGLQLLGQSAGALSRSGGAPEHQRTRRGGRRRRRPGLLRRHGTRRRDRSGRARHRRRRRHGEVHCDGG